MSWAAIITALWVLTAAGVACLPMRLQYRPGLALLVLAPALIVWLGIAHGWLLALAATAGFVSMFRNPLRYFWRRARGETPVIPQ